MKALVFILGWLLFVAAQAQNSVRSTANGLNGWAGIACWLKLQAVNLATRAFCSWIFYAYLVQTVAAKMTAVGLVVSGLAVPGVAGYAANALLYQIFGLLPWLRVEVQDLAPPSATVPPKGPTP